MNFKESLLSESEFYKKYGEDLRMRRLSLHISQIGLAASLGVHRNTLILWENGHAVPLYYDLKISAILSEKEESRP